MRVRQDGTRWTVTCDRCPREVVVEAPDWEGHLKALKALKWRQHRAGLDGRGRVIWETLCPECDAAGAGPVIPMDWRAGGPKA